MAGVLIDSSVVIEAERLRTSVADHLALYGIGAGEPVSISAIAASEILHGVGRTRDAARRRKREAFAESVLANFPVVPFDLLVARVHARLTIDLAAAGTPLPVEDIQIAATAIANGLDVATRDAGSFPRVPGLRVRTISPPTLPPTK